MSVNINGVNPGSYVSVIVAPLPTEPVRAEDVQVVAQSVANQTKWLDVDKASKTLGATFTGPGVTFNSEVTIAATHIVTFAATAALSLSVGAGAVFGSGLTVVSTGTIINLGRSRRRARVALADANATIDTTQGDCFHLVGNPAVTRTIVLRTTTAPVPLANEIIELIAPSSGVATMDMYVITREDTTVICTFSSAVLTPASITAQFEFSAGVWRLGMNSSVGYNTTGVVYGVYPGAGA